MAENGQLLNVRESWDQKFQKTIKFVQLPENQDLQ